MKLKQRLYIFIKKNDVAMKECNLVSLIVQILTTHETKDISSKAASACYPPSWMWLYRICPTLYLHRPTEMPERLLCNKDRSINMPYNVSRSEITKHTFARQYSYSKFVDSS